MEKMHQYLYLKVVSAATFSKKYFLYLKIHLQKVYYQYFQIRQKSIKISVSVSGLSPTLNLW